MKNLALFGLYGGILAGLLLFTSCTTPDEKVRVMSFNIRYANPGDGENFWDFRKEQVFSLIDRYDCDFVGIQEALPDQIRELEENLPDYNWIWRTREADPEKGEAVPLAYNASKWEAVWTESFWLSDTPDVPGSNTWESACTRISTWGLFKSLSTDKKILVCNTHFDHISQKARLNGARLILEKIEGLNDNIPVILLGDLNAKPDNPAILVLTELLDDLYPLLNAQDSTSGTFHGFKGSTRGKRIDYVMVRANYDINQIEIIRDNENGLYPSDHFPVLSDLTFHW